MQTSRANQAYVRTKQLWLDDPSRLKTSCVCDCHRGPDAKQKVYECASGVAGELCCGRGQGRTKYGEVIRPGYTYRYEVLIQNNKVFLEKAEAIGPDGLDHETYYVLSTPGRLVGTRLTVTEALEGLARVVRDLMPSVT